MTSAPPIRNRGTRGSIFAMGRSNSAMMSGAQYVPEGNNFIIKESEQDNKSVHSVASFHEKDFHLPELEFNNGTDLGAMVQEQFKKKRVNTLKRSILIGNHRLTLIKRII